MFGFGSDVDETGASLYSSNTASAPIVPPVASMLSVPVAQSAPVTQSTPVVSTLSDAAKAALAPYTGFTYYATGNQYYNPAQTIKFIEDLNSKFKLNLEPAEIAAGIAKFGDEHRTKFGGPVSAFGNQQTWNNMNGAGNFTTMSDPFAIAREAVGNVLRTRGLPEDAIQKNFYTPLQTYSTNSTDTYQKAWDGLLEAQNKQWDIANPDPGGSAFGDLLKNPVAKAMLGFATGGLLGVSGLSSLTDSLGSLFGSGSTAGSFDGLLSGLGDTTADILAGSAGGAGAAGAVGSVGGDMSWLSDAIDGITGSGSDWLSGTSIGDIGNQISDLVSSGQITIDEAMNAMQAYNNAASGGAWTNWLSSAAGDPMLTGAGANTWVQGLIDSALKDPLGSASKIAKAVGLLKTDGTVNPSVISGLLSGVGGYLSGNSAQDAANTQAQAQLEAARIAADAAKFRPVGVTTRFGQSNFTKDAQGNVTGAGYTLTPDVKAQQDALMGHSGTMLSQYMNAPQAFAPMGVAGQRAMSLGNQYLATDPAAQAQKYMAEQQALLATGRERDLNQMLTGEFNRGTYGLSTGGTSTGMMGANPRLEALMNAQRQQDLGLAAQATQGGMDYAKFGAGMVGTGGDLTNAMYQGQVNAFNPYKTALGGAQTLEGLGQNALDLGVNMGKVTNNAQSGMLLANGMNAAANTMAPANAYSPWGALLSGAGNQVQNYQNQQQQQPRYQFNPYTGQPIL